MTISVIDEAASSPPPSGPDRVDWLCDQFEDRWKTGERPDIAEYLQDTAEPADRSTLFVELVHLDVAYRRQQNERPRLEEYTERFPEYGDLLLKSGVRFAGDATVAELPAGAPAPLVRRTPARFGRYELRESVGSGTFGTVLRAYDPQLERDVAIKFPNKAELDPAELRRFEREARTAARLRHPHVVAVHEIDLAGETPYIVSEYVQGQNLRDVAKERRFAPDEAAALCRTIAEAMHAVHEAGVIHRDLKPGNILIDEAGGPHVADFGLAKREGLDLTVSLDEAIVGTLAYMPPEQAQLGPKHVDRRADVYALGVILYELLTGERPFAGSQYALLDQIHHADPRPPRTINKTIPRDLETICLKAMAKDAAERYQTAGALAEDLERFLGGVPVLRKRAKVGERLWRKAKRNPALVAVGTIALLATGAAIALALGGASMVASGHRLISMTTEPPGARLVFYRLDERTGEPDPSRRTEAPTLTPVQMELPPGVYFVVAALEDGRFHEVYRRVPPPEEKIGTGGVFFWEYDDDDERYARLRRIRIPSKEITADMAFFEGSSRFRMGDPRSKHLPPHDRQIRSFFVDPTEVSVEQRRLAYDRVSPGALDKWDPHPQQNRDDQPAIVMFEEALLVAEHMGKRLPTEAEYEYAATNGGTTGFPWGDDPPEAADVASDDFGNVGTPTFDVTQTEPPVIGLCSNVAEWTTTYACHYPALSDLQVISRDEADRSRVVRGPYHPFGIPEGGRPVASYSPRSRVFAWKGRSLPGVGFRCVRSAHPHLTADDFPSAPTQMK